jgi:hypothetical protein
MIEFALSNGGGLLLFSPEDVTMLVIAQLNANNVLESNSSTLLVSLAGHMTKVYSNKSRCDISPQITELMNHLTDSLLPALVLPEELAFPVELLHQPLIRQFQKLTTSNPELLFEYFNFLAQSMSRYSATWTQNQCQKWMLCILVSLGAPESGMSFLGAIDFLVPLSKIYH